MRKLYEIQDDLARIIEIGADRYVDGESGEIISKEDFENLQMEWQDKIEGVALGYKNEDAEAKSIGHGQAKIRPGSSSTPDGMH